MSAPSEPEKYSIDEMMERLKNPPGDDPLAEGELVTRADGSQAIRMRKRKRRSQQPVKEVRQRSRRLRIVQVTVLLILVLLVTFAAGVAIIFANSAPFRDGLLGKITRNSGAKAELHQFRMNPTSANAARLVLTWPEGNTMRELTLRNLKANIAIASFLGQSFSGEEVTCAEGLLSLRPPMPGQPKRVSATTAATDTPTIRFNRYALLKANVLLGESAAPFGHLQNAEASFYQDKGGDRARLLLNHGDLTLRGWPKQRMDRAHLEFHGDEVIIVGMRLRHESDNQGLFELTGTLAPFTDKPSSKLAVHLESYLLAGIAGPELGRLFSGRIETRADPHTNELALTDGGQDMELAITFHNALTSSFDLNGFPFLFDLAQTLGDTWFESPSFDNDVRGEIHRTADKIILSGINLENKGRMAVHGSVEMNANRALSGQLEIGVSHAMIQSAKSRRLDSLFGPPKAGFRWLTLKISGTASVPSDNFKELYQATQPSPAAAPESGIPSFEDLTRPK